MNKFQQRIINIYENLYKTNYIENDENITIIYKDGTYPQFFLYLKDKLIITLYSLLCYKLHINKKNNTYLRFLSYYNMYNYHIYKSITDNFKQIISYNNINNKNIKKTITYNNIILKYKVFKHINYEIIFHCSYNKYKYNIYIFYNKKHNYKFKFMFYTNIIINNLLNYNNLLNIILI